LSTGAKTAASYGVLLRLAWPIVLSRASQAVIGFTDAVMVAPLGEDAVAATTTGASNSLNLFILPMGIVFIVQSFASQLAGAGDPGGARRYAWYGLVVAAATMVLSAVGILGIAPTIAQLGYTEGVGALLTEYMVIRMLSAGAVVGNEAIGNWYAGLGNTRLPMLVNFGAMVMNIALNWVFIHGNLGAPALGVAGAALASAVTSWLAFALLMTLFLRRHGSKAQGARGPLSRIELVRMLRFGLPNGFNWFLEFAAFTFFINVIVSSLGTTAVAALMAVMQVNSISFMPAFGLASAGAILVGNAIGRGAPDEVPTIVRRTGTVAAIWQCCVGLVYAAFPAAVMGLFASDTVSSDALVALGTSMLLISTAWQLFDAFAITISEALRAAGDTAWCMWARVVLAWVLFVPLAAWAVLVVRVGPTGAIATFVVYLAALAGILWWRFRGGAWRRIDLTGTAGVH
jgi:MATE family multidrug resistance protein